MSLKQCCATGSLHTGTAQGRVDKLHGLDCYIAEPPTDSPKGVVVIIPDAFGWELPNNRILADEYAKNGNFRVILPDFMNGFVMPADVMISFKALSATGFWNQLYKISHALYLARYFVPFLIYCREAVARPKILSFFQSLRAANPLPLGAAGFCWGGKYVVELCWDSTRTDAGRRLLDCGFIAHPSMLKYPGDIEKVVLPLSCAAAEIDQQMSAEDAAATRKVLEGKTAKTREEGVEHEFVMYEGAHHGFAVRADEEDLEEAERGKRAERQAVGWFGRWFEGPPPSS